MTSTSITTEMGRCKSFHVPPWEARTTTGAWQASEGLGCQHVTKASEVFSLASFGGASTRGAKEVRFKWDTGHREDRPGLGHDGSL